MKYKYLMNNNYKTVKSYLESFYLGKSKYPLITKIIVNNDVSNINKPLFKNDILELEFKEEIDFIPQDYKLDILYEDDYLLIVNKDINLLVHPDTKDKTDTLVNYVAGYYKKKKENRQIHYLHRIDTNTSGIVMFAKDFLTTSALAKQIESHSVERLYRCVVQGSIKEDGTINQPIGEDRHHKQRRRVSKTGKDAITHYKVLKSSKKLSYLEVKLQTGRTHQIRVHMSYLNHPLCGDELYYGSTNLINRQALHSYSVRFVHPIINKEIYVECELNKDMIKLINMI